MKSARGARYFDLSLGELRALGGVREGGGRLATLLHGLDAGLRRRGWRSGAGGRCRLSFRAGRCNSGVRRLGSRACAAGPRMKELERERG